MAPREIGPYEVLGLIGRGGMGVVLRARHRTLGCVRALKVMEAVEDARATRFEREARALALVRHPNVVGVHDAGSAKGLLYFAMDLVEGGRGLDKLAEEGVPYERALELVGGVARGLHALHLVGYVHRDVKPQNVVVDARGQPIVIDLGLAKGVDSERLTKTGAVVGTPFYMAPEQAEGKTPPGPRTDVYSIGVVLYELLTRELPVAGNTPQEFFAALTGNRPIVPPTLRRPELPAAIDLVVAKALARLPEERYASAAELADDLADVRAGRAPRHVGSPASGRGRGVIKVVAVLVAAGALGFAGRALEKARRLEAARGELAAADARLTEVIKSFRRPTAHPAEDAPAQENEAALAGRAAAAASARGFDELRGDAERLLARSRAVAGEVALRRHDIAAATAALRESRAAAPLEERSLAALEGGIAALSSPADGERAERLLGLALDADRERPDLLAWRALERARRGQKNAARGDLRRSSDLGFDDRLLTLTVLALAGDPEEARRAILASSSLRDPSFVRPFVARTLALLASKGPEEALAACQEALEYGRAGDPELRELARTVLKIAHEPGGWLGTSSADPETVAVALDRCERLVAVAQAAAPDEADPELGLSALQHAELLASSAKATALPLRRRLIKLSTILAPDSFDTWFTYTAILAGWGIDRGVCREAFAAAARARELATTPLQRIAVSLEEIYAHWTMDELDRVVELSPGLLDLMDRATGESTIGLRVRLAIIYGKALARLQRWPDVIEICARADAGGYLKNARFLRAEARRGLGQTAEALDDYLACWREEDGSSNERAKLAAHAEEAAKRLGRPIARLDQLYEWAEVETPQRRFCALRRAALALEAGDRAAATRHLTRAAAANADAASDVRALMGLLEGGSEPAAVAASARRVAGDP